jgi:Putative prokaryotic signal transducing protein
MRSVATATNAFEARVIAARLGSAGIVWELRGSVDGPLALGSVEVLVAEDDHEVARELLLADAVESAFDEAGADHPSELRLGRGDLWWVALTVVAVAVFAVVRITATV